MKHRHLFRAKYCPPGKLDQLHRVINRYLVSFQAERTDGELDWIEVYCSQELAMKFCSLIGVPFGPTFPVVMGTPVSQIKFGTGRPLASLKMPPRIEKQLIELRKAGCDVVVNYVSPSTLEVILFGKREVVSATESSVDAFLYGLERGFVSSPLWEGAQQVIVPRSQVNDIIDAVTEILTDGEQLPSTRMRAAIKILNSTKTQPLEVGSPKLMSALKSLRQPMARVTRRSKRSA